MNYLCDNIIWQCFNSKWIIGKEVIDLKKLLEISCLRGLDHIVKLLLADPRVQKKSHDKI